MEASPETPAGSSPLSRGILARMGLTGCRPRIIPALAGNTGGQTTTGDLDSDHPRSRGEYDDEEGHSVASVGSSPLSRGIHPQRAHKWCREGIIPALAGNTDDGTQRTVRARDHPRSRGEYDRHNITVPPPYGSSPLSRGIQLCILVGLDHKGIIPALAGNTIPHPNLLRSWTDHPRSRGEYLHDLRVNVISAGSSPLSRGIRRRACTCGRCHRIIPALAGNTQASQPRGAAAADHPRSRGEYSPSSIDF